MTLLKSRTSTDLILFAKPYSVHRGKSQPFVNTVRAWHKPMNSQTLTFKSSSDVLILEARSICYCRPNRRANSGCTIVSTEVFLCFCKALACQSGLLYMLWHCFYLEQQNLKSYVSVLRQRTAKMGEGKLMFSLHEGMMSTIGCLFWLSPVMAGSVSFHICFDKLSTIWCKLFALIYRS